MTIEELSAQLIGLASKPSLTDADYIKVKNLMCSLKKLGMSNEAISVISDGRWSSSTVKGYTTGVKSSSNNPWQGHAELFKEMIEQDIDIEDVHATLLYVKAVQQKGVPLDDLIDICVACSHEEVSTIELVNAMKEIEESALTMKEVMGALQQINNLEKAGVGLHQLAALVKSSSTYGGVQGILQAGAEHASLQDLDNKVKAAEEKLGSAKNEQQHLEQEEKKTLDALEQHTKPLQSLEKVTKMGYGVAELQRLANQTQQYGGMKKFQSAFKKFADYKSVCEARDNAGQELLKVKNEVDGLYIKYSSVKDAIDMCHVLIREHGLAIPNVKDLLEVAKKYGQPSGLIKTMCNYKDIGDLNDSKADLEAKLKEIESKLKQSQDEYEAVKEAIEVLEKKCVEAAAFIAAREEAILKSEIVPRLLRLLRHPAEASYAESADVAISVAYGLLEWLKCNEDKFQTPDYTIGALNSLITEFGRRHAQFT